VVYGAGDEETLSLDAIRKLVSPPAQASMSPTAARAAAASPTARAAERAAADAADGGCDDHDDHDEEEELELDDVAWSDARADGQLSALKAGDDVDVVEGKFAGARGVVRGSKPGWILVHVSYVSSSSRSTETNVTLRRRQLCLRGCGRRGAPSDEAARRGAHSPPPQQPDAPPPSPPSSTSSSSSLGLAITAAADTTTANNGSSTPAERVRTEFAIGSRWHGYRVIDDDSAGPSHAIATCSAEIMEIDLSQVFKMDSGAFFDDRAAVAAEPLAFFRELKSSLRGTTKGEWLNGRHYDGSESALCSKLLKLPDMELGFDTFEDFASAIETAMADQPVWRNKYRKHFRSLFWTTPAPRGDGHNSGTTGQGRSGDRDGDNGDDGFSSNDSGAAAAQWRDHGSVWTGRHDGDGPCRESAMVEVERQPARGSDDGAEDDGGGEEVIPTSAATADAAGASDSAAWACTRCTLANRRADDACDGCGTLRDEPSSWRCERCMVHHGWEASPQPCALCEADDDRVAAAPA
jgi:hypothetical protein